MENKLPFFIRATIVLFGLFLFFYVIYIGQHILLPLVFSGLLALILHPFATILEKIKFSRLLSSIVSVLVGLIAVALIVYFVSIQLAGFANAFPLIETKVSDYFLQLQNMLSQKFGWSTDNPLTWFNQHISEILKNSSSSIASTLSWFTNTAVVLSLVPIYVFLFLFYRKLLVSFLLHVFSEGNQMQVGSVVLQIKKVLQKYFRGVIIECSLVGILQAIALSIIGIDYAILFGMIGGMLNVIPYIGGIISVSLPTLMALVTKSSLTYPLYVVVVYIVIQFADNHFFIPYIVASNVRINALISIVAVLFGQALCGVPGMFLAIPTVAIIKIIFDNVPSLSAWGILLGDDTESFKNNRLTMLIKKLPKKKVSKK